VFLRLKCDLLVDLLHCSSISVMWGGLHRCGVLQRFLTRSRKTFSLFILFVLNWTHVLLSYLFSAVCEEPLFNKTQLYSFTPLSVRFLNRRSDLKKTNESNMSTADPFQEIVEALRQSILSTLPPTASSLSQTPRSNPEVNNPPSPAPVVCPMVRPTPYSGEAGDCKGFLLQCSITFTTYPHVYHSDNSKIGYVVSCLSGKALRWAESIWSQAGPAVSSYNAFAAHFQEVFGRTDSDASAGEDLYHFRQNNLTVQDYSIRFRTLAAVSGWNERALVTTYRQGLEPNLRMMLAPYDDAIGLEKFIQLSLRCSARVTAYSQTTSHVRTENSCAPKFTGQAGPSLEPMDISRRRLTPIERQRRLSSGLCLYCGQPNHVIKNCPLRLPRVMVSQVLHITENMHPCTYPVTLTAKGVSLSVAALIDSGSAGNFIAGHLVRQLRLRTEPTEKRYQVQSIDGKPLSTREVRRRTLPISLEFGVCHHEEISLLVLEGSAIDIVLGRPWLARHEPILSWGTGEIMKWGSQCWPTCFPKLPLCAPTSLTVCTTSIESPVEKQSTDIPPEYHSFQDVFCPRRAARLPPHRPWDCAINLLPDAQLPRGRIYPLSIPETKAMEEYIQEALAHGYIRPSTSPAASSFFFVAKKDGGLRPCIDYRTLNKVTIPFKYPLPLVPAALEKLRGAKVFTKLDLRSAYNLIRIRHGDEWKTAFSTPTGHYEYLVMPYGLVNAPSIFQDCMHDIFREFLDKFVLIYIDDILIFSSSIQEHHQHVKQVLTKLREHQLFLKAEKCSFHQRSTQYLGYNIDPAGVSMDQGKVEAITKWPKPRTVKELQKFLGFANFYRRFIEGFSILANPLTSMLKGRPKTLTWSPDADQAFEHLKTAFTSAPILCHPDPTKQFVVEVDASTTGVGAILSQQQGNPPQLKPCAYFSRKLTPAERNYDIGNRELLAIKLALEEWRHWLEGSNLPFQVLTDHKNLLYLREAKRLNPRQARWALFFNRFRFSISYRPGAKNVRADALSRLHAPEEEPEPVEPILPESLFSCPIQWMTPPAASDPAPTPPLGCPPNLRFVPDDERIPLIHTTHTSLGTGHPGTNRTLSLLKQQFWWPRMEADVQRYVRGCRECAMAKTPRHLPAGKLVPLPTPNRPWSHLGVDFITDLPASEGKTCILVIVDRFSKFCRLISLKGLPTAWETAQNLFHHVFRPYGLPENIVSDRGPQFISRVWRAFFRLLGVAVSLSSGYHPQTNGQTERKIQEVGRFLRTFCHDHQDTWNQFLGWAEYAQNSLRQDTTGLTPFQCVLGFQPPLFPWSGEPSEVPAVDHWFRESERVWDRAHQHLQRAVRRQKTTADRRRSDAPAYQVGQKVWLSTRDIRLRLPCKKLSPRYVGPFTITEQVNQVTYKLHLPPHYKIHPTFHVSLLKPHHDSLLPPTEPGVEEPPPPMVVEEGTIYQVKEILNSRRRGGRLEYLIDWEGYGPEERSWMKRYSENSMKPTQIVLHPEAERSSLGRGAWRGG
ncbi:hypothetical protein M9458_031161, partial [Cirrhinus mrigala]